jgi:membrane-associated HD superfamily phosphohydrolase
MSNEIFQINNLKENDFEFDLVTENIGTEDIKATLVIESKGVELGFPCKKISEGKWLAKLPPLPMLERTAYPFYLRVVAEGYDFRPLKGSLNVVGTADLYVQNAKTSLESPTVEKKASVVKEAKQALKQNTTKRHEKSIQQIAEELMESNKVKSATVATKTVDIKPKAEKLPTPATTTKKEGASTVFFPNLVVEKKDEKKGTKDEVALKILEEAGLKPKANPKTKKRFSIKD